METRLDFVEKDTHNFKFSKKLKHFQPFETAQGRLLREDFISHIGNIHKTHKCVCEMSEDGK